MLALFDYMTQKVWFNGFKVRELDPVKLDSQIKVINAAIDTGAKIEEMSYKQLNLKNLTAPTLKVLLANGLNSQAITMAELINHDALKNSVACR